MTRFHARGPLILAALLLVAVALVALAGCGGQSDAAGGGGVTRLSFVTHRAIPASGRVDLPGSKRLGMSLRGGRVWSTGVNAAGRSLDLVSTTLAIDGGAPVGKGQIACSVHAEGKGARIARTAGGLRVTYPRPSEVGIYGQEVPALLLVHFPSNGNGLAELRVPDAPAAFTTLRGVKLAWPEYEPGTERLHYYLPAAKPKKTIELPFFTVWQVGTRPRFQVACVLETQAGSATVEAAG
jgi:hypothetical protein